MLSFFDEHHAICCIESFLAEEHNISSVMWKQIFNRFKKQKSNAKLDAQRLFVTYEVTISFPSNFQIMYRDEQNYPKLKEVNGTFFSHSFYIFGQTEQLELSACVYNPSRISGQHMYLCIKLNTAVLEEKQFYISTDHTQSGWQKITAQISKSQIEE